MVLLDGLWTGHMASALPWVSPWQTSLGLQLSNCSASIVYSWKLWCIDRKPWCIGRKPWCIGSKTVMHWKIPCSFLLSDVSSNDKCHKTSRIFPRTEQTFASARSFGVISWASFSRKNGPFGFERAPSASQKALSKSKGTFLRENECAKWYQNSGTVKICGRQRGIFVIICGIKSNFPNGTTSLKTTQMSDKNKACCKVTSTQFHC